MEYRGWIIFGLIVVLLVAAPVFVIGLGIGWAWRWTTDGFHKLNPKSNPTSTVH